MEQGTLPHPGTKRLGPTQITLSLLIDGVLKVTGNGEPLSYIWGTKKVASGLHTLKAVATNAAGNSSSATVPASKRITTSRGPRGRYRGLHPGFLECDYMVFDTGPGVKGL